MKEPDVTAIAVLVLVFGIGAGLDLGAGHAMTYSLTCDNPIMDAQSFSLELPERTMELGPLEFSDFELPEIEFVDLEIGIGPI